MGMKGMEGEFVDPTFKGSRKPRPYDQAYPSQTLWLPKYAQLWFAQRHKTNHLLIHSQIGGGGHLLCAKYCPALWDATINKLMQWLLQRGLLPQCMKRHKLGVRAQRGQNRDHLSSPLAERSSKYAQNALSPNYN